MAPGQFGRIETWERDGQRVLCRAAGGTLALYVCAPDLVRVVFSAAPEPPPNRSWAVVRTAWDDDLDDALRDERTRWPAVAFTVREEAGALILSTEALRVSIAFDAPALAVADAQTGEALMTDRHGEGFIHDPRTGAPATRKAFHRDLLFYGLGEKSGPLVKNCRRWQMHNWDAWRYDAEHTDPLYKHVPFLLQIDRRTRRACGFFFDNPRDAQFDLGCGFNRWEYRAAGGDLDYYIFAGPRVAEVVERFTDLTGKTALPPKWSLGYMGSGNYYTEMPDIDAQLRDFVENLEREDIPCDGFHVSSGYTKKGDKRYVFNWNRDRLRDPAALFAFLREHGLHVSPNVKPGMLLDHPLYAEASAAGAFIAAADADAPMVAPFWGGQGSFVDFSRPAARRWWKDKLKSVLFAANADCVWNDNCEFDVPDDGRCANEGSGAEAGAMRPVLSNLMARTAREAMLEHDAGRRPYVLSRAGYAGMQRYGQVWSGDNPGGWPGLVYEAPTTLGLGLSGVANTGNDVGGFCDAPPEPELFVRWVQHGIFMPRFSIHSSMMRRQATEPWTYPRCTALVREALRLRYALIPYLYSLFWQAATAGAPIMRPLLYEFQDDPRTLENGRDFLVGPALLVANVLEPGVSEREVCLPAGARWYDWETWQAVDGGSTAVCAVDLGSWPMFVREASVIVTTDPQRRVDADPAAPLRFRVHPRARTAEHGVDFTLYEDDGVSMGYLSGERRLTRIADAWEARGGRYVLTLTREGDWRPAAERAYEFAIGLPGTAPVTVRLNRRDLPRLLRREQETGAVGWYYDAERSAVMVHTPEPDGDARLEVYYVQPTEAGV